MSKLLINEPPLLVLPSLAKAIGLNEAIVLQQIHYWLQSSPHFYDGRRWVYNTAEGWQNNFIFWSEPTVRRILTSLRNQGVVLTGNYNKAGFDRTLWYSIDYEKLKEMESPSDEIVIPSDQVDQMDTINLIRPIPETTQETTRGTPPVAPQPKTEPVTVVAPYPAFSEMDKIGTAGGWANARGRSFVKAPGYNLTMQPLLHAILAAHRVQAAALEDSDLRTKWMRLTVRFHEAGLTTEAAVQALSRRWYAENPFGQKDQPPVSDQLLTFYFSGKSAAPAATGEPAQAYQPVFTNDDEWRA